MTDFTNEQLRDIAEKIASVEYGRTFTLDAKGTLAEISAPDVIPYVEDPSFDEITTPEVFAPWEPVYVGSYRSYDVRSCFMELCEGPSPRRVEDLLDDVNEGTRDVFVKLSVWDVPETNPVGIEDVGWCLLRLTAAELAKLPGDRTLPLL